MSLSPPACSITVILSRIVTRVTGVVRHVANKDRMRRACSLGWIYARNEPGVSVTPAPVVIGFVPHDDAVLSADGKSTTVVVMGDVVINHRIRRPYFKTIDRPPSSSLRSIVTGTATATDVARDGRSVRAGGTLYKDAAARSRPAYSVAGDDAVIA